MTHVRELVLAHPACDKNASLGLENVSSRTLEAKDMSSRTPSLLVWLTRHCDVCLFYVRSIIASSPRKYFKHASCVN